MMRARLICSLSMIALLTGCGDEPLSTPALNQAPETRLEALSPRPLGEGRFEIKFFWQGSDADGEIAAYEYRLIYPGRSSDGTEAAWVHTQANHLRLELNADPAGTGFAGDRPSYLFQVRAIDSAGVRDSSPAFSGFSSASLAPRVQILTPTPPQLNICSSSPRTPSFSWNVEDDDSKGTEGLQVRYALLKVEELVSPGHSSPAPGSCLTRIELEVMNPFPWIPEESWASWRDVDAAHDAGRSVVLPRMDYGDAFVFVVQARDKTGTKSRVFLWEQNYRHLIIAPGFFARLSMRDQFVGSWDAIGIENSRSIDVLAGQPLAFEWSGDASEYGGVIAAYRYGWDLIDPDDESDPGWAISWTPGARTAAPRSFSSGSHNFLVQAIDNSGSITRLGYRFRVIEDLPWENRRELLLVFDYGLGDTPNEQVYQELWVEQWNTMLSELLPSYDPVQDLVLASSQPSALNLETLAQYRSVIWFWNGGSSITAYADRLRPQPGVWTYNWLNAYQGYGGNLLMTGPYAMQGTLEQAAYAMPLLFTSTESPPDGLGVETLPNGDHVPRGMLRPPYQSFCLSASDYCRPFANGVYGEASGWNQLRSLQCDYLTRATVDPEFLLEYPSAASLLQDLTLEEGGPREPDAASGIPAAGAFYKFTWEEFYNANTTSKPGEFTPRPCQQVMFRWTSARDDVYPEGHSLAGQAIVDPGQECVPDGSSSSALTGTATAILSSVYSDTKPLSGSHDFVWGFHPLAFDPATVQSALAWIFAEDWGLTVQY